MTSDETSDNLSALAHLHGLIAEAADILTAMIARERGIQPVELESVQHKLSGQNGRSS